MRRAVPRLRRGLPGRLVLITLALALGQASAAQPGPDRPWLDPRKRIGQFVFDGFTSEDGLPSSSLLYLHQTRDGYLWITSFNGLVRFDGVAFTLFGRSTSDVFENNAVENLVEDRKGVLWVGVQGQGLVAYDRGTFRFDPESQRFAPFIKSLYVDDANLIWIGTQGDGVFTFDGKRFRAFDPGPSLRQVIVLAIRETPDGTLWFATEGRGVVSHRAGTLRSYTTADGLPSDLVNDLFVDSGGTLWASTIQGLARLREGRFEVVPETLGVDTFRMVEDGSGSLWLAAKGALFRIDPWTRRVESYGPNEGSPVHYAYQLCLDREGNLWITAYRGGLFRLKDGKVTSFTSRDGLRGRIVNAFCEMAPGSLLVGTDEGTLDLLENGRFRPFATRTPLEKTRIRELLKDSRGNVWVGTYGGLLQITPDGTETWRTTATGFPDDRIRVAMEDGAGRVWIGTRNQGIVLVERDGSISRIGTAEGLSSDFIMSLEETPGGEVLVGTSGGGLDAVVASTPPRVREAAPGLPGQIVFRTLTDARGVTWIAYNGGLARLSQGRLALVTERHGLPADSFFDIHEDGHDRFWLPSTRGITSVARGELEAVADGRASRVDAAVLGRSDGMYEPECTGTAKALRAGDGTLRFATVNGVVALDPEKLRRNRVPPPVYVTGLAADGTGVPLSGSPISLAPGTKRCTLEYTALSLTHPPAVRFKVKLEGFDTDWVDAGPRRSAVYTNLAPGSYTFRVLACNNDGIWSEEGASLPFSLRPYFHQMLWARALAGLALGAAVFGAFRLRIHALKRRAAELERIVDERTEEVRRQNEDLARQKGEIEVQAETLRTANVEISESKGRLELRNRFIRETFGRYLSDEVVTGLLEAPGGLRLGGEKRTVTILLSDLRGFSSLADGLDPVEVVSLINGYLEAMTEVIFRWGGTIDEFLGDAILVLFGAPVTSPDDPVRAAACALEMQREMAAVNARNRGKGLPEVEMGIGIHTGEAVVGNIGSARRAKYGVVGRSINFASRIESYTVGGQVLISEATRAALGDLAELGNAMEVHPKGLRAVTIHDLTGLGGSYGLRLERQRRTRLPLAAPLPCRFVLLEGKDARGDERAGAVLALSADGLEAEVRSVEGARAFSDMRLSLDTCRSAEVYAKVLGESPADGAFAVRFTAVPEEARRVLQAAAEAATGGIPHPA
jgi:class 3 adenylate cyclase/ligand-binding sensor domain-containing protein